MAREGGDSENAPTKGLERHQEHLGGAVMYLSEVWSKALYGCIYPPDCKVYPNLYIHVVMFSLLRLHHYGFTSCLFTTAELPQWNVLNAVTQSPSCLIQGVPGLR